MVSIPQFNRTVHLEAKFCSAYSGKKGLMRILMQMADCGYPLKNVGFNLWQIPMHVVHLGYPMNDDGAIPPDVFIWQCGRGNIQNIYNQCLLA